MKDKVTNYLIELGFEIQPCVVPLNDREVLKRDIFLLIKLKISNHMFRFLNKILPIKFKSERDDRSIWFVLRESGKAIIEVEFKPFSVERRDGFKFYYENFDYSKWIVRVYNNVPFAFTGPGVRLAEGDDMFYLYPNKPGHNDMEGVIDEIEHHFREIPILKQKIREKKLKSILNE
jgi:hypothetical protein